MRRLFLSATLVAFSLTAQAQDWVEIQTEPGGEIVYMKPKDKKMSWVKIENYMIYKKGTDRQVKGSYVALMKFDCKTMQYGLVAGVGYDNKGISQESLTLEDYQVEMKYALPESRSETIVQTHCQWQ